MAGHRADLLADVAAYYSRKLAQHGDTPQGVDWNGAQGQTLRFEQLCRLLPDRAAGFSLTDLGCGYGALFEFLQPRYPQLAYLGVDLSAAMVQRARARLGPRTDARFITGACPDQVADYCMASGILNVRLQHDTARWIEHVHATLDVLDRHSRLGFAFNCLSAYADEDRKRPDLFYADPGQLFDLCKRRHSRDVALLHDYGLYEFTMLVRKT